MVLVGKNVVQTVHVLRTYGISVLSQTSTWTVVVCLACIFLKWIFNNPTTPISRPPLVLLRCAHKSSMAPKDAKTGLKWNNRCKAHKILSDGLVNGTIDPSQKPKEVWESHTEFQKYPLHLFRSAFNRKKAELGCNLRAEGKYPSSQSFSFFFFGFFHPLFFIFCFLFSSHSRSFLT